MSQAQAAAGSAGTFMFLRRLRSASGRIRVTVFVCVVLICGSFASAAVIQMRLDRMHALSQAALFGQRRAQEMATELGASLDRYEAVGRAFASARAGAETSAALSEAGGAPLRNIAVFDQNGRIESEMKGVPASLLPLPAGVLARDRSLVVPAGDGRMLAILFHVRGRIVAVQIDSAALLAQAGMQDGLLSTASGRVIALGTEWTAAPAPAALALDRATAASRVVDLAGGARLVSLRQVGRWPLVAASSVRVEEALGAWYGALPLYLFFILGPAFAGAALAVLFVRVFERQGKVAAAIKALRSKRPDEARLLVRLADAERRTAEAERAKSRFVAQVSHELRTPLNAIIGFSEVIEGGVFGAPGHPKYVEYARDIGMAGRELHAKIGSVLEFAALDSHADGMRPGDQLRIVDAVRVARAAAGERAGAARARGLKLVVSLPEAASARAEPAALARVIAHLLDNALAYTPGGGVVRLEMRADARDIVIRVRDTGPGFTKRESADAGQPFQRFARPGAPGGMGVGLAIAMGLARRMAGTLSLSSVPGQGTVAELRLAAAAP
ncbi:MAG TPA: HAMP domain-containing sensor histidine kinase [Rhizomicrobium sp.]|jgi:signal transduction histidine kinase|nr:HAMP domain-containing sensor histidine kinase [Rhizomicrobium sp.]